MLRTVVSLCLFFGAISLTQATHSQQRQTVPDFADTSTFHSTTRLVNVDVVVTDENGQPVRGLTKDDFQAFDNGRPAHIAFLTTSERGSENDNARPGPGEYTNDPGRLDIRSGGAILILFDTINTESTSQAYSLQKIRKFLHQLAADDRVGIYVLTRDGLHVAYPPDQPASGLVRAIERYDEAHAHKSTGKTITVAEDSTGWPELDHFLQGNDVRLPMRQCDPDLFSVTFAAFRELARSTEGLAGRRTVVWVTERTHIPLNDKMNAFDIMDGSYCGMTDHNSDLLLEDAANYRFTEERGSHRSRLSESHRSIAGPSGNTGVVNSISNRGLSDNDELDMLIRLLTKSHMVFYPVSAEGLQTVRLFGPNGMDANPQVVHDPTQPVYDQLGAVKAVANLEAHQHMRMLAQLTGGRAFVDRNDLDMGIRRALDDARYSYELGYYPNHDRWNGDWHRIQVKVNRLGVTVLARGGYYALPQPRLLPVEAAKDLIMDVAASPLEATEIPVTVRLTPPDCVAPSTLEARVHLNAQNLFTQQLTGGWTGDFEVLFFQISAGKTLLERTTHTGSGTLTETRHSEYLAHGIEVNAKLQLKPNTSLLYVIVHDKQSDSVGSVRIPCQIVESTSPPLH